MEYDVACHAKGEAWLPTLQTDAFSTDEEPPLDYDDNVLDEEGDSAIINLFYDAKPLVNTPHVNGPSYKYWNFSLPVMANLFRLGRTLLSDQTDLNASYFFD